MKRKINFCLFLLLLLPAISFGQTWTGYRTIDSSSFSGNTSAGSITIFTGSNFHTCGSNDAGMIRQNIIGDISYKMLAAVLLTAITLEKQVALQVDGCIGTRAKILGLRLSQ